MFMRLFDEAYKDVITKQSGNVFHPNSLDPQVFYFPEDGTDPILLPSIKDQIFLNIEQINQVESAFTSTRVWNYVLTGPILNKNSSKKSPIIIKVQINKANLDDVLKEKILQRIKEINDKLAYGTLHPIIYIPTMREIEIEKINGAYDVYRSKWIKKPDFLEESKKEAGFISRIKQKPKYNLTKNLKKLERA